MNITLERKYKKIGYTIGKLYIEGQYFCDTLEDTDRGLEKHMSATVLESLKVPDRTAIPKGVYKITMNVVSPKYSKREWYYKNCNGGKLPRLMDVPMFEGVLIHVGNTAADSSGCILVGRNTVKGGLTESKITFLALYKKLKEASDKKDRIIITIN